MWRKIKSPRDAVVAKSILQEGEERVVVGGECENGSERENSRLDDT